MKCAKNNIDEQNYEIIITDTQGSSFKIYKKNDELCWQVNDCYEEKNFLITKENKDLFLKIHYLFCQICYIDKLNHKFVQDNKFEWISNDQVSENSNKLIIEKNNNGYIIKFIKNPLVESCEILFSREKKDKQDIIGVFESIFLSYKYYELEPNYERIKLYKL